MKNVIITAFAALAIAAPAIAQEIDGNATIMTRSAPVEIALGADVVDVFGGDATVSIGQAIMQENAFSDSPAVGNVTTAYVFGGFGDTGYNDFSGR